MKKEASLFTKTFYTAAFTAYVFGQTGCSVGGSLSARGTAQDPTTLSGISGIVSAGLVSGATVTAYTLNSNGSLGTKIASASTDSQGSYLLAMNPQSAPVIIVATGGAYKEEASGLAVNVGKAELRTVLPSISSGQKVAVTVVSEIAAQSVLATANGSLNLASLISSLNSQVGTAMGVVDITQPPANPSQAASAAASPEAAKYSLVLSTLSQLASTAATNAGTNVSSLGIAQALGASFTYNGNFSTTAGAGGSLQQIPVPTANGTPLVLSSVLNSAAGASGASFSSAMGSAMATVASHLPTGFDNPSVVPVPAFVSAPALPLGAPVITPPTLPATLPATDPSISGPAIKPAPSTFSIMVTSISQLPTCDASRVGQLAFVQAQSQFVNCDGTQWNTVSLGSSSSTFFLNMGQTTSVQNGIVVTTNVLNQYSAQGGTLLSSCSTDTWSDASQPVNGSSFFTRAYGPAGCPSSESQSISCKPGFIQSGATCIVNANAGTTCSSATPSNCTTLTQCQQSVSSGTLQTPQYGGQLYQYINSGYSFPGYWSGGACLSSCPAGQIPTSRGCESPHYCSGDKTLGKDNQCVALTFVSVTGNICGNYTSPSHISAGAHIVTCDSSFSNAVIIDPGTTFQNDDSWSIAFNGVTTGLGTSAAPITFTNSSANTTKAWSAISFAQQPQYQVSSLSGSTLVANPPVALDGTYNYGTQLSYVTLQNQLGTSLNLGGAIKNLTSTTQNAGTISLNSVYLANSSINASQISTGYSPTASNMLIANTLNVGSGSLMLSGSGVYAQNTLTSGYQSVTGGVYAFNTSNVSSFSCSGTTPNYPLVFGNRIVQSSGTSNMGSCLNGSNSSTAVSTTPMALISDGGFGAVTTAASNVVTPITVYVLSSTTLPTVPSGATWTLTHTVNGVSTSDAALSGASINVTQAAPESYLLTLTGVSGYTLSSMIGAFTHVVSVTGPAN